MVERFSHKSVQVHQSGKAPQTVHNVGIFFFCDFFFVMFFFYFFSFSQFFLFAVVSFHFFFLFLFFLSFLFHFQKGVTVGRDTDDRQRSKFSSL